MRVIFRNQYLQQMLSENIQEVRFHILGYVLAYSKNNYGGHPAVNLTGSVNSFP